MELYNTPRLSDPHRRQLEESGISEDRARERGYRTATRRAGLPPEFKGYQRRVPALVVPTFSPDGQSTGHQIRPDNPRMDKKGKPVKYETPAGSRIIIDVHPRMMDRVRHSADEPLWITEGIKSGDSLTGCDVPTVSLVGVWMAQRDKKLLPCWDHVRLHGRIVYIVFDKDVMEKEGVQLALELLVRLLEERGADVRIVYLTEGDVDDHIAAGGTIKELKILARRFNPEDAARFRLQRYPRLRAYVEALRRMSWATPWKGKGGHTRRDLMKELTSAAARHGEATDEGVRVSIATRTLEQRAATSRPTVLKQLKKLEEEGFIRIEKGRKAEHAATYTLLVDNAHVYHQSGKKEERNTSNIPSHPGGKAVRSPRLRWTYPGCKEHRRLVKGSRRPRQMKIRAKERVERLGKICGSVLDALDRAGGSATVRELCETLHRSRPHDLRTRTLSKLEDAGIITVSDDLVTLEPDWLEALELERELAQEIDADRRTRERHRREREAYRYWLEREPDEGPTDADLEAQRPRFKAALAAQRRADHEQKRAVALAAFCHQGSGARKNLGLFFDGELGNIEALTKSVLAWHRPHDKLPFRDWEKWRDPVLAAGRELAREHTPEPDDWRNHDLACECHACLYPRPRYARPYRDKEGVA